MFANGKSPRILQYLLVFGVLSGGSMAWASEPAEDTSEQEEQDSAQSIPEPPTQAQEAPVSEVEPQTPEGAVEVPTSLVEAQPDSVAEPVKPQSAPKALEVYDAALDIWHKVGGDVLLGLMEVVVTGETLDPMFAQSLSAVLAAELATLSRNRYRVISRNELQNMLVQKVEAQQLGCVEPSCLADIGRLAAADFMVTSSVGKVGEEWVLAIELIDVGAGHVLRRQTVTWKGEPAGLVEVCRPLVVRLIEGSAAAAYNGGLQILANEEGAIVHINDKEAGVTPIDLYPDLAIGRHRVSITKDGFLGFTQDVVVHRNETTLLQAELVDEDSLKPWYQKWWVWTAASAVVAGTVATAVMLSESETTVSPTSE